MSTESPERIKGYISQITFNNGKSLDIKQNDIVLFVGPNNVGKSRALKDIFELSKNKAASVVISDIMIVKTEGSLVALLDSMAVRTERPHYSLYYALGSDAEYRKDMEPEFSKSKRFDNFRDFFVASINTTERLNICKPVKSIRRDAVKTHPIHYAAFNSDCRNGYQ